jgi:hypothetical protein
MELNTSGCTGPSSDVWQGVFTCRGVAPLSPRSALTLFCFRVDRVAPKPKQVTAGFFIPGLPG